MADNDFTTAPRVNRRRDWSGMSHKEIVRQQSRELRGAMCSPSIVPEFSTSGYVGCKRPCRVGVEVAGSSSRASVVSSGYYDPSPLASCEKVSQPNVFYEERLTGEEPVLVAEWDIEEFVWTSRLLDKLPPYYFDLLHSLKIPIEDFQMRIEGFHCWKHKEDRSRRCSVEKIYLPIVDAGKYHPYQSFKHRCRASSQALDRLEFLEKECRKRRVKFDYVIKIDLTLSKEISKLWYSKKVQYRINDAVREFLSLLHGELFPNKSSRFGVIKNPHYWATERPLEPHRHVHLTLPNVVYNEKAGMFHRFRPFIDADLIRDCWLEALKKHKLWVGVPDGAVPVVYVGYIPFEERDKVINRLSYCARKPIEDLALNLTADQLFDFDKDFALFLLDYTPRRINLGFLSNLKRFGYSRKREGLRCPICGGKMELELDDTGQPVNCDRPPPESSTLIRARRREWYCLPTLE